jgi:hypothetical protein
MFKTVVSIYAKKRWLWRKLESGARSAHRNLVPKLCFHRNEPLPSAIISDRGLSAPEPMIAPSFSLRDSLGS